MRVLMLPFPAKAHVFSMVPLGWALRAAGHEVRLVARPNPSEAEAFACTGLDTTWVGERQDLAAGRREAPDDPTSPLVSRYRIAEHRPERLTPDHVRGVYELWVNTLRFLAPSEFLDDLVDFAEDWAPDLVIWDPIMYAGPLVARVCGAADARMLFAQDQWAAATARHLGTPVPPDRADPLARWMDGELRRFGLGFEERLRFGGVTLDPSPACLRHPVAVDYLAVRFVPFNGRAVVPDWVHEPPAAPRVCLTLGVSNREVHGHEQASVSALLDGVAGLDAEIVATLDASQLGGARVPDNVRTVDFVPLDDLLPSCAAIVHQGGGGTVGNAVVHGVPQLIVPGTTWSEQCTAHAFADHGNGLALELGELTANALRDGLSRLLGEPSFTARARLLAQEMAATPGPQDVVADLEALAARA